MDKLSEEQNKDNWYYYFVYGMAYYNLNDKENTITYLTRHLELNKRSTLHEQAYYELAKQMLDEFKN